MAPSVARLDCSGDGHQDSGNASRSDTPEVGRSGSGCRRRRHGGPDAGHQGRPGGRPARGPGGLCGPEGSPARSRCGRSGDPGDGGHGLLVQPRTGQPGVRSPGLVRRIADGAAGARRALGRLGRRHGNPAGRVGRIDRQRVRRQDERHRGRSGDVVDACHGPDRGGIGHRQHRRGSRAPGRGGDVDPGAATDRLAGPSQRADDLRRVQPQLRFGSRPDPIRVPAGATSSRRNRTSTAGTSPSSGRSWANPPARSARIQRRSTPGTRC
jgi:hypothetical protein